MTRLSRSSAARDRTKRTSSTWTICLAVLIGCGATDLVAQETVVRGRVMSRRSADPLPGVLVAADGRPGSTTTDLDGRFRLALPFTGPGTLRFTAVGFRPQSRVVLLDGDSLSLDVYLSRSAYRLEDVVVTATGARRQRELGHAVGLIDADLLAEERVVNDIGDLLTARTPGLTTLPSSGLAGTGTDVRIRGATSMLRPTDPVVLLDGIRVEGGAPGLSISGGEGFSRLDDLNPNDIESIEVARGPSAATMYGTGAASGIIRITTKRGQPGPARWKLLVEQGLSEPTQTFPANYASLDAAGAPCPIRDAAAGACEQAELRAYNPLNDPDQTPLHSAWRHRSHLEVSGGQDAVQYYVAGGWATETGVMTLPPSVADTLGPIADIVSRPNRVQRGSLRANLSAGVGTTGTVTASAGFSSSEARIPMTGGSVLNVLSARQTDPEGPWNFPPEEAFATLTQQSAERTTWSVSARLHPFRFLETRATLGLDRSEVTDVQHTDPGGVFRPTGVRLVNRIQTTRTTADLSGTISARLTPRWTARTTAGIQHLRYRSAGLSTTGRDLLVGTTTITGAASTSVTETTGEQITLGTFVEQQVSLNERLFLTAGVRADDNSTAGADFDFILYPKLGVSWTASDEPFFPALPAVSSLRLRAAWGASGIQPAQNDARLLFTRRPAVIDGQTVLGVRFANAPNPDLRPERATEIEIGFDAGLADDRVGVVATYYRKRTHDALFLRPLAPSLGAGGARLENLGQVDNTGVEVQATATLLDRPSSYWTMEVQFATMNNTVVHLCPPDPVTGRCEDAEPFQPGLAQRIDEGFPVGAYFAYPLRYSDADANGLIDASEVALGDSLEYRGTPYPTRTLAVSSSLSLANRIRISALADYRGGHLQLNLAEWIRCSVTVCRAANDPTVPLEEQARAAATNGLNNQIARGLYLEPGWLARLRELSVSVTLPRTIASPLGLHRLDVTLAARNLAAVSGYSRGDPEVNSASTTGFDVQDFNALPAVRYWVLKLHAGF